MATGDSYSQNVAQTKNLGYVVDTGVKTDTSEVAFLQVSIGDAVITAAVQATGTLAAGSNPADGSALPALNGFADITFLDSPGAFPDVQRESTRAATLATLASQLNSAVAQNPILYSQLAGFTYTSDSTHLIITANEGGTAGNDYTLGANAGVWTRSAATLTTGAAATVDYPGSASNPIATNGTGVGAANIAINQVTAGVASGTLVAARATRRSVTVRNQDAANSAYIGTGTVTSGNGFLLKAGESIAIDYVGALNCIRDSADVALGFVDTYN